MGGLLKLAGFVMAVYGLYVGEIYVKYGMSARTIVNMEEPVNFRITCFGYLFVGLFIVAALNPKYG